MRDLFLIAAMAATLPMILVRPYIGVYAWFVISLLAPQHMTWGIARTIPFGLLVAVTTVPAWLVSSEKKRIPWNATTIVLLLFWLQLGVATAAALSIEDSFGRLIHISKIFFFTYVAMSLINTKDRLIILVYVLTLSVAFYGLRGGFFAAFTGGEYLVYGDGMLEANNSVGIALGMTLPLIWFMRLQAEKSVVRWGCVLLFGFSVLAVLATYSRGAWLGIAAMGAVLWLKSRGKIFTGVLLIVAAVTTVSFMPERFFSRVDTIEHYEDDESAMSRLVMWKYGWRLAVARPLTGGGLEIIRDGRFYANYGLAMCQEYGQKDCTTMVRSAHSNWVQVLGETGFPGLFLFVLLLVLTFRSAAQINRMARDRDDLKWARDLASMVQVSLVAYTVAGSFVDFAFFDMYYALVAVIVLTRERVREALDATATAAAGAVAPVAAATSTVMTAAHTAATQRALTTPKPT